MSAKIKTPPPPKNLSPEAWNAIGAQWRNRHWEIPERNADGEVVGTSIRAANGDKWMKKGSRRGLTMRWPLDKYAGLSPDNPILIVEGATDTAAGESIGYATIGRPGANGGLDYLRQLLKGRHVCIVGENDGGVGETSPSKIASGLLGLAASVRIIFPPAGVKDLCEWVTGPAGADHDEVAAAIAAEQSYVDPDAPGPVLICMDGIEPANISWTWRGRIPQGRVTLLVGRPGDGKSFLTAYLAANVSTGRDWIDGSPCPQGSVILCSAEDDPADTIAPRLIAHGADRSRIHLLRGVRSLGENDEMVERVFTLADLPALRLTLEKLSDCKLIVIDPIGSYLPGRTDAHRDNEVRSVLAPVAALAAEHGAAVLVVAHTRKAAAANADDMAMGSRAFTGLARSVLHLLVDPDDETKRRRLLLPGKNNLAERPAGLAFDIGPGEIEDRPCMRWIEGEVDISADEAVNRDVEGRGRPADERDEAVGFLQQALAAGARPSKDVLEQAKETEGIAEKTLRRAMKVSGVEAYRPENPGPWWWRLNRPEAHGQSTWPAP